MLTSLYAVMRCHYGMMLWHISFAIYRHLDSLFLSIIILIAHLFLANIIFIVILIPFIILVADRISVAIIVIILICNMNNYSYHEHQC